VVEAGTALPRLRGRGHGSCCLIDGLGKNAEMD